MKTNHLRLAGIACAAALALALGGCGSSLPPEEPVQVPTEPPVQVQNTLLSGSIVDSATGSLLTGTAATVAISGAGAGSVVTLAGAAATSLSTTTGQFSLALRAGVTPTAAAPVNLTFSVTRSGNVAVTVPVSITATGTTNVEVKMLPLQATAGAVQGLPTAVATGTATTATATTAGSLPVNSGAGTTGAAFVASTTFTPAASDTNAKPIAASAAVPPTVTAGRDVGGTIVPAAAGPVVAQVIASNPTQPAAVAVLPPVAPVPATSATAADTTLPTLSGAVKINIVDSAGNPVNKFSAPIKVTIDLQGDAVNPDTNQPYAIGEKIDIATFDEATSTWVPKKLANGTQIVGTVVSIDAATTNRKVEFETDKLSWFAFWRPVRFCATGFTLAPAAGDTRSGELRFFVYNQLLRAYIYYVQPYSLTASQTFTYFMPRGSSVSATLVDRTTGQTITTASAGGCVSTTINIPAPVTPPGSITVTTREQCPDGTSNRALPAAISITSGGRAVGSGNSGAGGSVTIAGIPPGSATVTASFATASGTQTLSGTATVVSGQTATVPLLRTLSCQPGTGGTGGG